ncbi:MAG: cyclic dehypoxanthinyl futalosine synthase [Candidatus Melainabacteria bacterium]|nr:cyclic dehypoxanthinyl futalosine synthase [Candidatus Melainabacteria bacterium]
MVVSIHNPLQATTPTAPSETASPSVMTGSANRLDFEQALALFRQADLLTLGMLAEQAKARWHAANDPITFVIDRTVNYTNVCNVDCLFCAFYRHADAPDAYVLPYEVIASKAQGLLDVGGTQLLLQGGVNPNLPFEYYTDLLRRLRSDFPTLTLHAFSPTEIAFMVELTGWSLSQVIAALMEAGLDSIPGGGAEILHDEVRRKVSHKKVNSIDWLDVMEAAHGLGLRTTATMMFGMVEKDWHIVDHLFKIRALQDRTGGFTAFIPWTFQKPNTKLEKLPLHTEATGVDYLRVLALSRIVLDNIANIQSSWLTPGMKLCQVGLHMGANDMGGLVLEENVVTEAGVRHEPKTLQDAVKLIHGMGRDAAQRDTAYRILKQFPQSMGG